jgi:hypothetical protein
MIEYADTLRIAPSLFASHILPLAAAVKSDGKIRMLVDPSFHPSGTSINAAMAHLPVSLPSAELIFSKVSPTSMLGKRDLDNGFFHVVLSEEARRTVAFRHPVTGRLARWVVLPQGTRQSPAIFCTVTEAAARIFNRQFRSQGIQCEVFVYVDDFIFVASSHSHMRSAFQCTDQLAHRLGLSWKPSKDIGFEHPTTILDVLGLTINAPALTLTLPHSSVTGRAC